VDVLKNYVRGVIYERLGRIDKHSKEIARTAVREIVNNWKEFEDDVGARPLHVVLTTQNSSAVARSGVRIVSIVVKYDASQHETTKVEGTFDRIDILGVRVTTNTLEMKDAIPNIISNVQEVLRHELEHVSQAKIHPAELKATHTSSGKMWDYVKQPMEARAWVRGMWRLARHVHKPFTTIIDDRLAIMRKRWERKGADPKKIEAFETKARELWLNTAREMGLPIR
jgi:hypothetical protein